MKFKMNKILNMFMSAGDKFIPKLHLRHSKFTLSACDSLLKIVKGLENSENQVVSSISIKINEMKPFLLLMQHILIVKI